jgi:hypothetical protein
VTQITTEVVKPLLTPFPSSRDTLRKRTPAWGGDAPAPRQLKQANLLQQGEFLFAEAITLACQGRVSSSRGAFGAELAF